MYIEPASLFTPEAHNRDVECARALRRYLQLFAQQARLHDNFSTSHGTSVSPTARSVSPMSSSHSPTTTTSMAANAFCLPLGEPCYAIPDPPSTPTPAQQRCLTVPGSSAIVEPITDVAARRYSDDIAISDTECETATETETYSEAATRHLLALHQDIKATLTELMNTETAKSNSEFRGWVQRKLYDAQREIKGQRRRRVSSLGELDRGRAGSCGSI